MRKKVKQIFSIFVVICFSLIWAEASVPILPLNQVKAGMKGKGKSVFAGNKIEEFDFEILGILHNVGPKRSIILAKLKNEILDNTGVIAGMSGSPVYVDGKLIGAVAYSLGTFVKETIAGITPIEEMLAISKEKPPRSSFSHRIPIKKQLSLEEIFELNKEFFLSRPSFSSEGQALIPLNIPLVFSGFSSQVFGSAKSFFSRMGFNPVRGGSLSQSTEEILPPELTLREGDPVAVQLVKGDLDLSAVGTTTYVDGNTVLAFGHPLYNLGAVDYAMARASVITVIPSLAGSFKLTASDNLVGTFTQDRSSGLLGELGKIPKYIPINVMMVDPQGEIKNFNIQIANDKILSPALVNLSLASIISSERRALGNLSLELGGDVYLENGRSVHLEDLFSGSFDNAAFDLSNLLAAVVYFLTNNEFKDLGIHRIDLGIRASEEAKFSYLEKVWLDKYEASPGESIQIKVYYRTFRGEIVLREAGIIAPNLPPGSEFQLVIGDAASMNEIERNLYKATGFVPRSLNQLIRILGNLRKNNRIYFKILASKPGLFLKGEELPNLPPTMKSMFSSPRAAVSAPTKLDKSTLSEYQLAIPYVFRGGVVIPVKIKK